MVEIQKKYQIGTRRFGLVNWVGFKSLYIKEVSRFIIVWAQTLLSPLVSSLLFLSVLTLAIGNERGEVLGITGNNAKIKVYRAIDKLKKLFHNK